MLAVKGRADVAAGKMAAAQQALREAAALIAEADPPLAAELLSESVAAAIEAGLDEEASRDAERMSKLAERSGETAQFLADLTAGRLAWIRGDPGLGMLLVQRAASRLASRPALALSADRQLDVARAYSSLGDHPRAWPYYERTIELARSTGAIGKLPAALSDASFAAAETGKWLQALALGSQALELAQATGQDYLACDALVTLAGVEAAQGRTQDCLKHVHEADLLASELGLRLTQLLARRQRALLELGTGQLEEAIEHYEALRRLAAQWDISHPYYSPIADLIEAYARAGALDEARKLLPEFLAQVPGNANPLPAARAARCQGIVAAEDYDPHFRTAINLQEQSGHAFQHARSLLCYGERLRRAQRRRDARIQLRASIEIFDLLDARPWADRARAELRASGETISGGGAGGDRLTPQELQIALLVTQGRTNAEIGRAIFLSTRTVEFHLSRAYRKLGISSRTELASRLASTPVTRQNSRLRATTTAGEENQPAAALRTSWALSVTRVLRGCQLSAVSKRARRSVSRSAGSLAKTRRRYRPPLGPQPSIGVAATWARVNSRRDASPGVRPMLRVSMSSDQPPCGRTHGYPASWSRTSAQRCCQTLVAAATSAPDPGWFRAAATACWAMPTWQTTLVRPARPMSAMISPGRATQPTRQPIIRSSLDADPTVIVQSARSGWAAGWTGGWPSKRIRSIAASQMTQARCRRRAGDRIEMLAAQDRAGGHDRAHQQHRGGARPDGRRELARVGSPPARAGGAGHEPGHAARQADPVDQPGIDRVADHHLLAGFHGGQQHVQDPVQSPGDADALGTGVIAAAGGSGHVRAGGLTQRQMTLERQVTVRVITIDGGVRGLQCHRRRPQIGVQVLQPQNPRISRGVGGIANLVHPDSGNVTQPGNGHGSLANQWLLTGYRILTSSEKAAPVPAP